MGGPISKFDALLLVIILAGKVLSIDAWDFFQVPPLPDSDRKVSLEDVVKNTSTESEETYAEFASASQSQPRDDEWYSKIVPDAILANGLFSFLKRIVLYKPPVGIFVLYLVFTILLKRRKLVESMMVDRDRNMDPIPSRMQRQRIGRSLNLDSTDSTYDRLGGVDAVRSQLCIAALCEYMVQNVDVAGIEGKDPYLTAKGSCHNPTFNYYAAAAREALETYSVPKTSREYFVKMMVGPMERIEKLYKSPFSPATARKPSNKTGLSTVNELNCILWTAAKVAEIRALDALLRVLRERLLTSAMRLSRKKNLRAIKLGWYENNYRRTWFRRIIKRKTLRDDRRNFQLTSAALKREMERLGNVQKNLLSRPEDLSETSLLMASSRTVDNILGNDELNDTNTTRSIADCAGQIDSNWARYVLVSVGSSTENVDCSDWATEAKKWTKKTRELIYDLVIETVAVEKTQQKIDSPLSYNLRVLSKWKEYDTNGDRCGWGTVLSMVNDLSRALLLRERKYLPNLIDIRYWARRLDVYGIPSTLTKIGIARLCHEIVKPFQADIVKVSKLIVETLWGIIEFRFIEPLRYITLDLLNRRPKLLDPFYLSNEETMLDNMLRNLGIGDGTRENRPEALLNASRMYEEQVAAGAVKNLLAGSLMSLLLVQIQQLKAGVIEAMGSVDDLVDSNRLNIQLLAIIPALLLVRIALNLFFAAVYSLRSGRLGLSEAHSEMGDILLKMERCLLLASHSNDKFEDQIVGKEESDAELANNVVLKPKELGNFVLLMHSYLVILDYCNPPFPTTACDSIHAGMQDLLLQGQIITRRQIALLQILKSKHGDLLNTLF